jgi:hypothetical protein
MLRKGKNLQPKPQQRKRQQLKHQQVQAQDRAKGVEEVVVVSFQRKSSRK